jgi:hypothetical protein
MARIDFINAICIKKCANRAIARRRCNTETWFKFCGWSNQAEIKSLQKIWYIVKTCICVWLKAGLHKPRMSRVLTGLVKSILVSSISFSNIITVKNYKYKFYGFLVVLGYIYSYLSIHVFMYAVYCGTVIKWILNKCGFNIKFIEWVE